MRLKSLLFSQNQDTVRVLTRVLEELDIAVELCTDAQSAVRKLTKQHCHAVIVDADDERAAIVVVQTAKAAPASERPLVVVLADTQTRLRLGFDLGAHITLYKPISFDRVRHSLCAVRNLMFRERRRASRRIPVHIPATARLEGGTAVPAFMSDLSEEGALLRWVRPLPASHFLTVDFLLPDTSNLIRARAEIVWQDAQGQSGLRFSHLQGVARRALVEWLKKNSGRHTRAAVITKTAAARK